MTKCEYIDRAEMLITVRVHIWRPRTDGCSITIAARIRRSTRDLANACVIRIYVRAALAPDNRGRRSRLAMLNPPVRRVL